MPQLVVSGAMLKCSFGLAPSALNATSAPTVTSGAPAATIMDHAPAVNIPPFGMCTTQSNPAVAAATAAALGVPTPSACVPNTPAPWQPGATSTTINNFPALTSSCTCNCMWGGVITITNPGQTAVTAD